MPARPRADARPVPSSSALPAGNGRRGQIPAATCAGYGRWRAPRPRAPARRPTYRGEPSRQLTCKPTPAANPRHSFSCTGPLGLNGCQPLAFLDRQATTTGRRCFLTTTGAARAVSIKQPKLSLASFADILFINRARNTMWLFWPLHRPYATAIGTPNGPNADICPFARNRRPVRWAEHVPAGV